jgi:Zn/Cd-binding protein ZinT
MMSRKSKNAEISRTFSIGEFSRVYPYLADNIIWKVVGENEFIGKKSVVKNCEQVRQYFDSVTTDFKTIQVDRRPTQGSSNGDG